MHPLEWERVMHLQLDRNPAVMVNGRSDRSGGGHPASGQSHQFRQHRVAYVEQLP